MAGWRKCTTHKRNHIPADTPRVLRANWASKGGGSLQRMGRPMQWTGLAGPDIKENSNKSLIFEFQGFLEFCQTCRNSTRRFRRNLDMEIFPKFF
jgi:hypothetical protein